jgi:hypothetical protein
MHGFPVAVCDAVAKHTFSLKDALRMVTQGTMAKIAYGFFGGIQPIMDVRVIFWLSAKYAG